MTEDEVKKSFAMGDTIKADNDGFFYYFRCDKVGWVRGDVGKVDPDYEYGPKAFAEWWEYWEQFSDTMEILEW